MELKTFLYRKKDDASNSDYTNSVYKDCEKDDLYIFNNDSTFTRDDNTVSCGSSVLFGLSGSGNWIANEALTELTVSIPFFTTFKFTVDDLTAGKLVMEETVTDYFQDEVVYTYEFESQ